MKKLVLIACAGIAGLSLLAFSNAASSSFEGVITYSMSFGGGSNPQAAAMMQGSNTKVYIKGNKARTEVSTGMYRQVTISDWTTKDEVSLIDMMGSKYEIKSNAAQPKKDEADIDFKYMDSTKQIAGYACKAAIATMKNPKTGETYNTTIFYTDKLPYSSEMGRFKGLKGFALQFAIKQQGMDISMTAQSVEQKPLSDTLFAVPTKGYKIENSREDMMKDIQRNMGGGGGSDQ